jgi:enoyl-CoA hydratase
MPGLTVSMDGLADGQIATIVIDRPDARNALSQSVMSDFAAALDRLEKTEIKVLVIRGGGDRAFISGGDIKDLAELRTYDQAAQMAARMRDLLDRLASLPALTIAALNGHALGGGAEVAVACDLRLAAVDVTVAFNQSQLGIMPAWGGTERLTRLVGRSRALELLLMPRRLSASEAQQIGLVNDVVTRDHFDQRLEALSAAAAQLPITVLKPLKGLVDEVQPPTSPMTTRRAVDAFATAWVSDDHWSAVDQMVSRGIAP